MDRYEKILYAYVVFKPMILSMKYYTVNLCYVWSGFFLRKMLGTRYGSVGTRFL